MAIPNGEGWPSIPLPPCPAVLRKIPVPGRTARPQRTQLVLSHVPAPSRPPPAPPEPSFPYQMEINKLAVLLLYFPNGEIGPGRGDGGGQKKKDQRRKGVRR